MHQEKLGAAITSLIAAGCVGALKLITGLLTGSLGMLSESAHSGIDIVAAGITLFSVQVSDRPADEDHNYGHGKIESLSAFVETVLMLGSCVWIVYEAVERIFLHPVALRLHLWPFAVLLLSMIVDYFRSRALMHVARRHASEALEADALHFSTDVWSSAAVMAGLFAAWAGQRWKIPHLELADSFAALLVAAVILRVSWRLARRTMDALLDATPAQTRRELIRAIGRIDGVLDIERVRVRRSGNAYFADLSLGLARNLTFQRSEQIVGDATATVQKILPGADVVVHSMPRETAAESIFDRARAVAARNNVSIHDVSVQQYGGGLHLEQHLEMDEKLSLRAAHDFVTQLENQVRTEVPGITSILTHIESEPATIEHPASVDRDRALEVGLRSAARAFPEILDIHDVVVSRTGDRTQINCHCTLADDLPMAKVHEVITALESSFKMEWPEVSRVLIHPEPATDNRR